MGKISTSLARILQEILILKPVCTNTPPSWSLFAILTFPRGQQQILHEEVLERWSGSDPKSEEGMYSVVRLFLQTQLQVGLSASVTKVFCVEGYPHLLGGRSCGLVRFTFFFPSPLLVYVFFAISFARTCWSLACNLCGPLSHGSWDGAARMVRPLGCLPRSACAHRLEESVGVSPE